MRLNYVLAALAALLQLPTPSSQAASFARAVVAYDPGTGFARDFATGAGLTNSAAALGAPARIIPGPFGGPVDPFNPPYLPEHIVSIGSGGSLLLELDEAVADDPSHPFGVDFILFGSAGFVITNGNFSGGGRTDGSLFAASSTGATTIAVSSDGLTFHPLMPPSNAAGELDHLFPTDAAGDFTRPVNPQLAGADFSGLNLEGIRTLYQGSGGGTGMDIAWSGRSGHSALPPIRFVRIEVHQGHVELDAVSIAAPRQLPGWTEDFSGVRSGAWQTFGDAARFQWDSPGEKLRVHWDSDQPNSLFYRPLGTVLTTGDDFELGFQLRLEDLNVVMSGPYAFEIALGLLNSTDARQPNFRRGTGVDSPNLLELDYFPDTGFGATISPVIISTNNQVRPAFAFPAELSLGVEYQFEMIYRAADRTLRTRVTREGQPAYTVPDIALPREFTDFQLDSFSINNWTDDSSFGRVTATATVDNIAVVLPPPPVSRVDRIIRGTTPEYVWGTRPGWSYTLESSANLEDWDPLLGPLPGTGGLARFAQADAGSQRFYRVKASRP